MILLETAFFPPVSYFAAIAEEFTLSPGRVNSFVPSQVWIEACENYQKQSYRNRCRIYAAGGVENLSIPIVHENGTYSLPIKEIQIDWTTPWLTRLKRAIVSAYETSAYFEYYKDELFSLLDSRPEKLFDLNMEILKFFLSKTGIAAEIHLTEEFTLPGSGMFPGKDLRGIIHPKRDNSILSGLGLDKPYWQVFSPKHGFIPDLSIMDLLFNEGPDSVNYLKSRYLSDTTPLLSR
ncbi:MAG: WbqC family protein [Candidatus Cryptobacteroides sp.]